MLKQFLREIAQGNSQRIAFFNLPEIRSRISLENPSRIFLSIPPDILLEIPQKMCFFFLNFLLRLVGACSRRLLQQFYKRFLWLFLQSFTLGFRHECHECSERLLREFFVGISLGLPPGIPKIFFVKTPKDFFRNLSKNFSMDFLQGLLRNSSSECFHKLLQGFLRKFLQGFFFWI